MILAALAIFISLLNNHCHSDGGQHYCVGVYVCPIGDRLVAVQSHLVKLVGQKRGVLGFSAIEYCNKYPNKELAINAYRIGTFSPCATTNAAWPMNFLAGEYRHWGQVPTHEMRMVGPDSFDEWAGRKRMLGRRVNKSYNGEIHKGWAFSDVFKDDIHSDIELVVSKPESPGWGAGELDPRPLVHSGEQISLVRGRNSFDVKVDSNHHAGDTNRPDDNGYGRQSYNRVSGSRNGLLGAKVLTSVVLLTAFLIVGTELICRVWSKRKWQPAQVFLAMLVWILVATVVILAGATWAII